MSILPTSILRTRTSLRRIYSSPTTTPLLARFYTTTTPAPPIPTSPSPSHLTSIISSATNPLTQLYLHWLHHSHSLPFPLPPSLTPPTKSLAGLKLYTLLTHSEVARYMEVMEGMEGVRCDVKDIEEEGGEDRRGMEEELMSGKELELTFEWENWELARRFIERTLELSEVHDHHCKIILQPLPQPHPSPSKFSITIQTHTHTPLLPKSSPTSLPPSNGSGGPPAAPGPGLTRKDFLLAWDLARVGCEMREETKELSELEGAGVGTEDGL